MKAQIGSVSEGTLRVEDLISIFLETLKGLDDLSDEHTKLVTRISFLVSTEDYFTDGYYAADKPYDLEDLFDALNEYSPSNCYFGAHIGDGSDFGWWPVEEDISCHRAGKEIS